MMTHTELNIKSQINRECDLWRPWQPDDKQSRLITSELSSIQTIQKQIVQAQKDSDVANKAELLKLSNALQELTKQNTTTKEDIAAISKKVDGLATSNQAAVNPAPTIQENN